jgi:hypothetical protein
MLEVDFEKESVASLKIYEIMRICRFTNIECKHTFSTLQS